MKAVTEDPTRPISWKKIYAFLFKKEHLRLVCMNCKKDADLGEVGFPLQPKDFYADQAGMCSSSLLL